MAFILIEDKKYIKKVHYIFAIAYTFILYHFNYNSGIAH